ncbi:TetR/AcrR family transcriptional regulator [Roseovarius faecimaris]|nr:TetR family transcriptional regulator [Roseovarius faecimaris]
MTAPDPEQKHARRDPERHREALITATLDLIAEIGVPETTVSRIIERAGLSRGMIHLHFGGKDQLLIAAAQSFSASFSAEMETQLACAGDDPADVILTAIEAEMSAPLMNERSARIWHAFRGIANPSPEIAHECGTRGGLARDALLRAFRQLAKETRAPDPETLAQDASYGTMALLEGVYVDYLANTGRFSRTDALRAIRRYLAGLFPERF